MLHKKRVMLFAAVFVCVIGVWTATASSMLEQHSVLSGRVISTVQIGTAVSEGSELVKVSTLAGSATAARATTKGIVREVLVSVGSEIKSGDIVVRIEAQ